MVRDPPGARFCPLHCELTWQCLACGALVHGKIGTAAHFAWHEKHGDEIPDAPAMLDP